MTEEHKKSYWETIKDNKMKIGGAMAGVGAGVVALPILLPAAGFSVAGVAAGSVAAGAQSFFYGAATTGVFSACQSMGVVGVSAGVTAGAGAIFGTAGLALGAWLEDKAKYREAVHITTEWQELDSKLHLNYGLKRVKIMASPDETEYVILFTVVSETKYNWYFEDDKGNYYKCESAENGDRSIRFKSDKSPVLTKISVMPK